MSKIEKDIPMPEFEDKGRSTKYPWTEMEFGDSFFSKTKNPPGVRKEYRDAGLRFRSAPEGDGWRTWRVEDGPKAGAATADASKPAEGAKPGTPTDNK